MINGIVQLWPTAKKSVWQGAAQIMTVSLPFLALGLLIRDERQPYVAGASDNASAVACLLGLGLHLHKHPLNNTEVWLLFTGAEEVMCVGMHAFLDTFGKTLSDAWFLDFEMVGASHVAYVTEHSGFSYLNRYTPDHTSLQRARRVAQHHPELEVTGRKVIIVEEIGTVRKRGLQGLCIVSVGGDGWLAHWHQESDIFENIHPESVEKAARFALEYMKAIDKGA
jgi:hypothetical protein